MPKIRILPDQLANQIAAGEVVERPASVVKELIENSLDAGADRIEIDIEGGGSRLIRVVDNGEGMDEDDVLLCLERHGTSKINEVDDLIDIQTLGFRGEALPSISSVAKLVITSRPKDSALGTTLVCHYGAIKKVHETGTQAGTTIEISNLFGNTPARRKFLRTRRTELSHIEDCVINFCLAEPSTAFTLRVDDRVVLSFDSDQDQKNRMAALTRYDGGFIEIQDKDPHKTGIKVTGLLIPPDSPETRGARLRIFVNKRGVKDRMISHGVYEGMRSFLLKGRSPSGLISIEVPPSSIDVNVHPAKHEIRFRESTIVHKRIIDAVRNALISHQQRVRSEIFTTVPHPSPPQYAPPDDDEAGEQHTHAAVDALFENSPSSSLQSPGSLLDNVPPLTGVQTGEALGNYSTPPLTPSGAEGNLDENEIVRVEDLFVIGSFKDLYIFCRNKDKLIVIDQHAAHERILFEALQSQYSRGKIAAQQLLFPVSLELTTFQSQLIEKHQETFADLGFSIREFGGNTWVLASVPAIAGTSNPQDLFLDFLEQFGSEKEVSGGSYLIDILATMACKAAVKSGDQLTDPEIKALLTKMIKAQLFSHCPHGRPVVKILDAAEIKKWFYRT